MRRHLCAVVATGLLVVPGTACAQKTPGQKTAGVEKTVGVEQTVDRTADLHRLEEWVEREQSLSAANRREANRRIEEWLRQEESFSNARFFLAVASITALADNGHSNTSMGPAYNFGLLPIRSFWFSDGLYIVRARNEHKRLLGARINGIAGLSPDELVDRLGIYHGGTDENFRQYYHAPLMLSPAILQAAGLSDDAGRLALDLSFPDGSSGSVRLAADRGDEQPDWVRPWRLLVPAPIEDEDQGWSTVFSPAETLPMALRDPDKLHRYELLKDDDLVYIQLRYNHSEGQQSIQSFVAKVRKQLEADRPRTIVLDNRQNPGGDLGLTANLALDLPSKVPEDGMVYVLTSNATFSAGIYTSFFPKAANPAKTRVVGERVGDRERFWAEIGPQPLVLPDTGYHLGYSLKVHDLGEGCHDAAICHMTKFSRRWNIAVGSLDPDVVVPTTFADYAANRDPVLDYVLRLVRPTS